MCACNPPVCFSIRLHMSPVALYACMRVYSQVVHMQERARLDFGLRLASLIGLKKYVPCRSMLVYLLATAFSHIASPCGHIDAAAIMPCPKKIRPISLTLCLSIPFFLFPMPSGRCFVAELPLGKNFSLRIRAAYALPPSQARWAACTQISTRACTFSCCEHCFLTLRSTGYSIHPSFYPSILQSFYLSIASVDHRHLECSNNAFCNSYLYDRDSNSLLVHKDRLSSSGDFGLIVVHALSHIKVRTHSLAMQ